MGAAVRGGGAVGSGPRNKMVSEPSMKTGKVVMASKGGAINQHKEMAMGMMGGGMPMRGYKKGGMAKKKVKKYEGGGNVKLEPPPLSRGQGIRSGAMDPTNYRLTKKRTGGAVKKMRYGGSCG